MRSPFKPKMFACFAPSVPDDWKEEEEAGMTTPRKEDDQNKVCTGPCVLKGLQGPEIGASQDLRSIVFQSPSGGAELEMFSPAGCGILCRDLPEFVYHLWLCNK